jgi:hypothetical protein
MRKIAPHSAEKGRLRPSFFFCCCACLWGAALLPPQVLAQEAVYRCGKEYTNAPRDASRCERLPDQSVTLIPGPKPARVPAPNPAPMPAAAQPAASEPQAASTGAAPAATGAAPAATGDAPHRQRDQQARTIVVAELERTRQRHAELVQEYRQGAPAKTEADAASPQKYQERVAQLKAAIERHERDMDSLQRELARRPAP